MTTHYIAVHSAHQGPVFFNTPSLTEARQFLADRIQEGECKPEDTMAIVAFPLDQTIYFGRRNTVSRVLGHVVKSRSDSSWQVLFRWMKTLVSPWALHHS